MAKPLRVKAVLQYPEGLELGTSPEIKRFKVTRDGDDLYRRLMDTLPTVFPDVRGLNYSLYWKDDDDDMVQFSSMDELQAALENTMDNLLRIYIVVDLDTDGGETTTTSDTEGEERKDTKEEETKTSKRVSFYKAGKRWRRRLRRLRKSAMTDDEVVSKEFRKAIRVLMKQAHKMQEKKAGKEDNPLTEEEQTTLGSLTPEAQVFVQQIFDEWHSTLANKRLRVVAKKIRKEKRTFPSGFEKDHFRWLCRYMARWHRRHAGKCDIMSGWSSGETGDDTSGDEETLMTQNRKNKRTKKNKQQGKPANQGTAGVFDPEDTDGPETSDYKVPKEFRKDARSLMTRLHRKKAKAATKELETLTSLSPQQQAFITSMTDDWHSKLATKRPKVVAKHMRKMKRELPSEIKEDHFRWLCRFMGRWHRRRAGKCDLMSGWSSGEAEGETTDEEDKEGARSEVNGSRKSSKRAGKPGVSDGEDDTKEDKVPKEFRKGVRVMVKQLHRNNKAGHKQGKPLPEEEQTTLAALSPEVQTFIQQVAQDWHKKLSQKRPRVVAKRIRKQKRTFPSGLEKDHFRWLCRYMARWHRRHAGKCDVMSGWSSGETGDDTSDDEFDKNKNSHLLHGGCQAEEEAGSESEATDCLDTSCKPVSKEFRSDVRLVISLLHKDTQDVKKTPLSLTPEVHDFLKQFCQDWHSKLTALSKPRPRAVSKEMKEADVTLPSRLEKEQYRWLCCFIARWHRKHAGRCDAMSGVKN